MESFQAIHLRADSHQSENSQLSTLNYFGYDGHGNVRFLTDATGAKTDTYDYDAFGVLIASTGNTPNNYLYCGEQWDADWGMYFLRARYLNPGTGRFWTMDSWEGTKDTPAQLHKYLYALASPVNYTDPSGYQILPWWWFFFIGARVHDQIGADFISKGVGRVHNYVTIADILGIPNTCIGCGWKPDLVDTVTREVYEIKSENEFLEGYGQLGAYLGVFNLNDPFGRLWIPGDTYLPPSNLVIPTWFGTFDVEVRSPLFGVITYKAIHRELRQAAATALVVIGVSILVGIALKAADNHLDLEVGNRVVLNFAGGGL